MHSEKARNVLLTESSSMSPKGDGEPLEKEASVDKPASLTSFSSPAPEKPRQWLYDRCNGKSKYGVKHPPCPLFYVPFPVKIWPDILEQNCLCERIGNIGVFHPEESRIRKWLLRLGLWANILSFLLSCYACVAIANNYDIIRASSLSFGEYTTNSSLTQGSVYVHVGLRAVALTNVFTEGEETIKFEDFCDLVGDGLFLFIDPERCHYCEEISLGLIITLFLSLLGYIPTILTDVLRMYPNYDVNCQKAFASFFSLFSLAMAVRTWKWYENRCFHEFYQGETTFVLNETSTLPIGTSGSFDQDDPLQAEQMVVHADWNKGPGMYSLQIGALLKVVDIIVNILIPTPSITRHHDEQLAYEELPEGVKGIEMHRGLPPLEETMDETDENATAMRKSSIWWGNTGHSWVSTPRDRNWSWVTNGEGRESGAPSWCASGRESGPLREDQSNALRQDEDQEFSAWVSAIDVEDAPLDIGSIPGEEGEDDPNALIAVVTNSLRGTFVPSDDEDTHEPQKRRVTFVRDEPIIH